MRTKNKNFDLRETPREMTGAAYKVVEFSRGNCIFLNGTTLTLLEEENFQVNLEHVFCHTENSLSNFQDF